MPRKRSEQASAASTRSAAEDSPLTAVPPRSKPASPRTSLHAKPSPSHASTRLGRPLLRAGPANPGRTTQSWALMLASLQSKPDRVSQVKHLTLIADHKADKDMQSVMNLLGPRLESLRTKDASCAEHCDCQQGDNGPGFIDRLRCLPQLRILRVRLYTENWQEAVLRALRSTPALVELEVDGGHERGTSTRYTGLPPDVPHLKRVRITGESPCELVRRLASGIERFEISDTFGGRDVFKLDVFENNQAIKHVDDSSHIPTLYRDEKQQWLPKLESISRCEVGGWSFWLHPTVKHMRFYGAVQGVGHIGNFPQLMAILPTETHTGLIYHETIEIVETSLGLIQIVEALNEHASTDGWWDNADKGLHISSFNDSADGETFYHMRVDLSRDWAKTVFIHWPDDIEPNSTYLYADDAVFCDHCPEHKHLRWVDFTSYYSRPIPHTLLRDIYDLSGLSPDWKEGRRDLKLSIKASEALEKWADNQLW